MGMYDTLSGKIRCPKCNKKTIIDEQIKWADCLLNDYKIGSKINIPDGIYDWGSAVRPELKAKCIHCGYTFSFDVVVKKGKIKKYRSVNKE